MQNREGEKEKHLQGFRVPAILTNRQTGTDRGDGLIGTRKVEKQPMPTKQIGIQSDHEDGPNVGNTAEYGDEQDTNSGTGNLENLRLSEILDTKKTTDELYGKGVFEKAVVTRLRKLLNYLANHHATWSQNKRRR